MTESRIWRNVAGARLILKCIGYDGFVRIRGITIYVYIYIYIYNSRRKWRMEAKVEREAKETSK